MKIVDRKTFLALPDDTLFCKWEPCCFGELTIKGESLDNDFREQQIGGEAVKCNDSGEFSELCNRAAMTGASVELDFYGQGRDGCYDEDQMFAVWETADVAMLIERLILCMNRKNKTRE